MIPNIVGLESLGSTPFTDFERVGFALYFIKQNSLAKDFAEYAAKRLDNGKWVEIDLLTLAVPTSMLANTMKTSDIA